MTLVIPQSGCLQCRRPRFNSWVGKILWRRDRLPTPVFLGFLCGSAGKESTCNVGDPGSIPGLGRYPGEGNGYPLQYFSLENSMNYIVHGVAKSQKRLSNFHFHFSSVAQSCLICCDPMNHSMPGLPVHHQLLEFTQTHVHSVGDAIQPYHFLSSPSPPAPSPSQHHSLFQ